VRHLSAEPEQLLQVDEHANLTTNYNLVNKTRKATESVLSQVELERNRPVGQLRHLSAEPEQLLQVDEHASLTTNYKLVNKAKNNKKRTFASRVRKELTLWTADTSIGGAGTTGARCQTC
jgi:hypothetical protein